VTATAGVRASTIPGATSAQRASSRAATSSPLPSQLGDDFAALRRHFARRLSFVNLGSVADIGGVDHWSCGSEGLESATNVRLPPEAFLVKSQHCVGSVEVRNPGLLIYERTRQRRCYPLQAPILQE